MPPIFWKLQFVTAEVAHADLVVDFQELNGCRLAAAKLP